MATKGSEMNELDGIVVLRAHLEELESILRNACGYHVAYDLAENYRAGRPNMKGSRLTLLLERAHTRIEGYLNDESIQPE